MNNYNNHNHSNNNTMTIMSHYSVNNAIIKENKWSPSKKSPFMCGFNPKISARLPFSSGFFLIAVIFMNFYVEIALLLPMPITMYTSNMKSCLTVKSVLLLILIIGLYLEWNQGSIEWSN